MAVISSVPWIVVALVIYNAAAFMFGAAPADGETATVFDKALFSIPVLSGAIWLLRSGDLMIVLTLVLLFLEILKASHNSNFSVIDHALSLLLFIVCLVEFIVVPQAATSVFFIILLAALIDVTAGFIISVRFARRDLSITAGAL